MGLLFLIAFPIKFPILSHLVFVHEEEVLRIQEIILQRDQLKIKFKNVALFCFVLGDSCLVSLFLERVIVPMSCWDSWR